MMMRAFRPALPVVVAMLAGACAAAPPSVNAGLVPASEHEYLRSRWLMVPVSGVRASDVPDTYRAPRGANRQHNATGK
jgi:hypothetical protein